VAGVALGLVLLAAFALTGRGLGASGAFASSAAGVVSAVAPQRAAAMGRGTSGCCSKSPVSPSAASSPPSSPAASSLP
jgi:hypothetical protein